jgi:hypothetical protein
MLKLLRLIRQSAGFEKLPFPDENWGASFDRFCDA